MNKGFNELWPTSVYRGEIEDKQLLNSVCEAIFLESDITNPANTFQPYDILRDGSSVFQKFRDQVVWPAFINYLKHWNIDLLEFPDRRLRSWITGTQAGYMIPVHNHSGSTLSAVFYLITEEQNKGGELVLVDPRSNANRGYKDQFKPLFANKEYLPYSGEFVIFPGFVYHQTIPFSGTLRLAMPVDLFL
jgi:hypothetical protein